MPRNRNIRDERSPSQGQSAPSPKDTEMSSPQYDSEDVDGGEMESSPETAADTQRDTEAALQDLQRQAEREVEQERAVRRAIDSRHPSWSPAGGLLASWRRAAKGRTARPYPMHTPIKDMTNAQLDHVFPSIGNTPSKPMLNKWEEHQARQTQAKRQLTPFKQAPGRAQSELGLFGRLPGELRNYIYRLAFVPPPDEQPVLIEGSDLICGRAKCIHRRSPIAAPGIASSCRQIRQELMPIYTAENSFKFDGVMVRNRCPASWIRAVRAYAAFIPKITLEVQVLTRTHAGTTSTMSEIVLECPAGRKDGRFEMTVGDGIPKQKLDDSGFREFVYGVNDGMAQFSQAKLEYVLGSDELAELVFRCRK